MGGSESLYQRCADVDGGEGDAGCWILGAGVIACSKYVMVFKNSVPKSTLQDAGSDQVSFEL